MTTSVDPASSSHVQRAITDKRAGGHLSDQTIHRLVADFVAGRIADYQMSAWLATVACVGLDLAETAALTRAYVDTGRRLRLDAAARPVVDKHSTGGVGDKATLVVAPLVAACGVRVVKLSGRGLGHAGGTIDKLESLPGLRLALTLDELAHAVDGGSGLVLAGQSDEIAPGDAATYALRDVTATVESAPLIAASIISKKLAIGADVVVLDVKYGAGALVEDYTSATELAQLLVDLGDDLGLRCEALLTDMNEPMGRAVGNALEVKEALAVLRGEYVRGLSEPCHELATVMLQRARPELDHDAVEALLHEAVASGDAHDRFVDWAGSQGADPADLLDPGRLPTAGEVTAVRADRAGWLHQVSARLIGSAAVRVGAGRYSAGAALDHAAGLIVHHRVGDRVEVGTVLAEIHHNTGDLAGAVDDVTRACVIGDEPCAPIQTLRGRVRVSPDRTQQ